MRVQTNKYQKEIGDEKTTISRTTDVKDSSNRQMYLTTEKSCGAGPPFGQMWLSEDSSRPPNRRGPRPGTFLTIPGMVQPPGGKKGLLAGGKKAAC